MSELEYAMENRGVEDEDDPREDPTDRAFHTLCGVVGDFEYAIRTAATTGRIGQLRERLKVAVKLITDAQDLAAQKDDAITRSL